MCGAGTKDSAAVPANLNTGANSGGLTPTASVVLENPNRDPEPEYAFVLLSTIDPVNLKRPLTLSTELVDSVALENPKRDPEPL